MKSAFKQSDVQEQIARINNLTPSTVPQWGKMDVAQMLAHCCVAYEMTYTDKYPKPGGFKKFMLKLFVKNAVVGPAPYKKNGQTAPEFKITGSRDFAVEKQRLVDYLQKTLNLGEQHFEGKESHSFGALKANEWNTMFVKHLDHHLTQFGV
jgi:hypothetical protein